MEGIVSILDYVYCFESVGTHPIFVPLFLLPAETPKDQAHNGKADITPSPEWKSMKEFFNVLHIVFASLHYQVCSPRGGGQ